MKPLVIANWKCNPATPKEAKELFCLVAKGLKNACPELSRRVEIVICPPFVYMPYAICHMLYAKLGSQDCFWEQRGAFTGEVSPIMLKNLGVEYVIIGHSERRRYFKETDEMANKKVRAALENGLRAILCVDKLSQIEKGLKGLSEKQFKNLVVAYEPVFAIGSARPCSIEKAKEMNLLIKKKLKNKNVKILYGGSINSKNAAGYIKEAEMDGLLVGGASLDPQEFIKIIKAVA